MKTYFIKTFSYNTWADETVVKNLIDHKVNTEIIIDILSHYLLAEKLWLLRLQNKDYNNFDVWDKLTLDNCRTLVEQNAANMNLYLNSLPDGELNEAVEYNNLKGDQLKSNISDILTQLTHHSAYHRGQIAREVRKLNFQPAATDYILYSRNRGKSGL